MSWKTTFTEHPASVGETYAEHMAMASSFSARMALGAGACMIHAIFPFLFVKTGSSIIAALHERMVIHRDRRSPAREPSSGVILARHAPD